MPETIIYILSFLCCIRYKSCESKYLYSLLIAVFHLIEELGNPTLFIFALHHIENIKLRKWQSQY